jgi:hypothetical protein
LRYCHSDRGISGSDRRRSLSWLDA